MTYQQLDLIADLYIPLLLCFALIACCQTMYVNGFLAAYRKALPYLSGVGFVYSLMLIDIQAGIWPAASLDYSTHTALALVFVTGISFYGKKACITAICSLLFYCALMFYQKYHTVLDMLSTAIAVLPFMIWLNLKFNKPISISTNANE